MSSDAEATIFFGFKIEDAEDIELEPDEETGCLIGLSGDAVGGWDGDYYVAAYVVKLDCGDAKEIPTFTEEEKEEATKRLKTFCEKYDIEFQKPKWCVECSYS